MTAEEKREAVCAKYRTIIGRNLYSQDRRNYCYKAYSNGKYYSDCSSSVCYTYKECGYGFGILNTVGIYQAVKSGKLSQVPVTISGGQITNPSVLRKGDMLLYAGNDSSRAYAGYVGHVEMLGEINGSTYILYGHGSGNPKKTEMTAKNRSRYNTKASTKLGNRGLIMVARFIQDDDGGTTETEETANTEASGVKAKSGSWNVRSGPGTEYSVIGTVKGGTAVTIVDCGDWEFVKAGNMSGWMSKNGLDGLE